MAGLTKIRGVLFDAVGTLIYPDPPVAEAYRSIGRRFGSRLSVEQIAARFPAGLFLLAAFCALQVNAADLSQAKGKKKGK